MPDIVRITLVVAPGIPESEREALESHVRETVLDPDYTLVLNYDAVMDEVLIPEGSKVLIVANGIPVSDLAKLRERFNAARLAEKPQNRVIVVNYEVRIDVHAPAWTKSFGYVSDFEL